MTPTPAILLHRPSTGHGFLATSLNPSVTARALRSNGAVKPLSSTALYIDEVVPESELVVRQTGAALGVKSRLAAEVAVPPLALSPNGCKGKKSRIARRGKPR
jgi:hypothetical protein